MPAVESEFFADDGLRLHQRRWLPQGDPAAAVILVHGIIEHGGRYAGVGEELSRRGYAVYAMDLRGHGRSAGDRLWVEEFDRYLADLDGFLDHVRHQQPEKPVFLLGNSMGGAIVGLYAILRQPNVCGVVLSVPAVEVAGDVFPLLRRLAALASRIVPRLRLVRLGAGRLSRDPQVVADFRDDPLVFHGRIPVRTGAEVLRAGRRIRERMADLRLPLLLLHGTEDTITDPRGSRLLHARAGSRDKTLMLYEGLYHDLFHEPEHAQIIEDLARWLDAHRTSCQTAPGPIK
jgi:acylglycerol lipase